MTKKRKKLIIFSGIGLVLAGLTVVALMRDREPVFAVEVGKVTRRDLTELVPANGRIYPVLQVKISPEVSGEIIDLPVKEGQKVEKGELLLKIKPDFYIANRNQSEASYKSSLADKLTAEANAEKAELEFRRNEELFRKGLISDSAFLEYRTAREIANASLQSSVHRVEMASASLARVEEELAKTTIRSPLAGTVSRLNSEPGERVVGTAQMAGTEVMTIADLTEMEARVDIGETDIVLIQIGQKARLEVDAFKDRKFTGVVTEIANSSQQGAGGQQQEATRFEVKVRIQEAEPFRPGMSVTAEIETRYRTNVLAVPIQSVATRLPKKPEPGKDEASGKGANSKEGTNQVQSAETSGKGTANRAEPDESKAGEPVKPIEVVFVLDGDRVRMAPVKMGISDDTHIEITEGLSETDEIVTGGFKAVSRDLEDGKRIRREKKTDSSKEGNPGSP